MKKRAHKRFALLACGPLLLLIGVLGVLTWRAWQQEQLNQALLVSIHRANLVMVQHWLAQGADPNAVYRSQPPTLWQWLWEPWSGHTSKTTSGEALHAVPYALYAEDIPEDAVARFQIVQVLIQAGASANVTVPMGSAHRCLLMCALCDLDTGSFKQGVLRFLLAQGADVNGKEGTEGSPLTQAAWERDAPCVQILLDAGADVQRANAEGETALTVAASHLEPQALRWLLERGANVNGTDPQGWTPLMGAVQADATENAALLLGHGSHIDAQNAHGDTALMLACGFQYPEMVGLLLNHHARLNIKNLQGQTALRIATRSLSTFGPVRSTEGRQLIRQRRKQLLHLLTQVGAQE